MSLIKSVTIKNFKAVRDTQKIELLQGNYIVGGNNSGKTTVLQAIDFFFSNKLPTDTDFLNKSEYIARQAGYNRCEISVEFNIEAIISKIRGKRLSNEFGKNCVLSKIYTFKERTETCTIQFSINGEKEVGEEDINQDLKALVDSVKVSYLHPQDGVELLARAQEKLKDRLILNWGRRGNVTESLEKLKTDWQALRESSDIYLSRALSEKLQQVWPGCEVKVNLPKTVAELIKISDIGIKGAKNIPEISLTSQGTGAQSMILYLAHFLLDSDRSLHRGEYHPLWLLEEPESFLHADLMFQIGKQLVSKEWLSNIQMIVSTHSPIILACSRETSGQVMWVTMKEHSIIENKVLKEWEQDEIKKIGYEMGDSNFEVYFTYAEELKYFLFLEDSREETINSLKKSGVLVTKGLRGTGEVHKYIDTFLTIATTIKQSAFFLIDHDMGKKEFNRYLKPENLKIEKEDIEKYGIRQNVYLLLLPEEYAYESLYEEFDNFLEEKIDLLYKINQSKKYSFSDSIPSNLTRTHAYLRDKSFPNSKEEAKRFIRNTKDVKDLFWQKVRKEKLVVSEKFLNALKILIED